MTEVQRAADSRDVPVMRGERRPSELECRHCGQRFLEMVKLLFHPCPKSLGKHGSPRGGNRPGPQRRTRARHRR